MADAPLKPCPFCGGTSIKFAVDRRAGTGMWHSGDDIWGLNCTDCGASHPNRYNEHGRQLLIEDWNRRTPEPDAQRFRKLVSAGRCDEKHGRGFELGNRLKSKVAFRYWCEPDELRAEIDAQPASEAT